MIVKELYQKLNDKFAENYSTKFSTARTIKNLIEEIASKYPYETIYMGEITAYYRGNFKEHIVFWKGKENVGGSALFYPSPVSEREIDRFLLLVPEITQHLISFFEKKEKQEERVMAMIVKINAVLK